MFDERIFRALQKITSLCIKYVDVLEWDDLIVLTEKRDDDEDGPVQFYCFLYQDRGSPRVVVHLPLNFGESPSSLTDEISYRLFLVLKQQGFDVEAPPPNPQEEKAVLGLVSRIEADDITPWAMASEAFMEHSPEGWSLSVRLSF
jgi:hypothetical protein